MTGADACDGDSTLNPQNDCLPFSEGGLGDGSARFFDPDTIPSDACEVLGEGTPENPYKVCDYWVLLRIGASRTDALPLNGVYEFTADIDASATCGLEGCETPGLEEPGAIPIGSSQKPFTGTVHGEGHSISYLYINREGNDGVGLFGALGSGAVLEGFSVNHAVVRGGAKVGVLAGSNRGGSVASVSLRDVSVSGARASVGVLLGVSEGRGQITGVQVSEGTVTGASKVGGLVGENGGYSIIRDSWVNGAAVSATGAMVGGLVGENSVKARIENSYADSSVDGQSDVGGLVGSDRSTYKPSSISLSYSRGSVRGSTQNVGGLVGKQSASVIRNSYSKANVQGPAGDIYAPSAVGGLVGHSSSAARIEQSYAAGSRIYGSYRVGGLVGYLQRGQVLNSHAGYHANSEASGMLVEGGTHAVGGLVGHMSGSGARIEKSYSAVYKVRGAKGSKVGGLLGYLERGSVQKSFSATADISGGGGEYLGALIGHCNDSTLNFLYFRSGRLGAFGRPAGTQKPGAANCYVAGGGLPSGIAGVSGAFLLNGLYESYSSHLAWAAEGAQSPWARLGQMGDYPCLSALPDSQPGGSGRCVSTGQVAVAQDYPSEYVANLGVKGGSGQAEDGDYTLTWDTMEDTRIRYRLERSQGGASYQSVALEGDGGLTRSNADGSWSIVGQDYGTYSYRVRTCYDVANCNPGNGSLDTVTLRVSRIPALELSVDDKDSHTDRTYTLSWSLIDGSIARYEWAERSDSTWPSTIRATGSIDVQDLPAGAKKVTVDRAKVAPSAYYYKVRACGAVKGECGAWSPAEGVRVDLPALETFLAGAASDCQSASVEAGSTVRIRRSLRVIGGASTCYDGSFKLTWKASRHEDVAYYEIQERLQSESWGDVSACPSCAKRRVLSSVPPYFLVSGKAAGNYAYRLRLCSDLACSSSWSNEELIAVPELDTPSSFGSDEKEGLSYDGEYVMSWDSVANADRYIIRETEGAAAKGPWSDPPAEIEIRGAAVTSKSFAGERQLGKFYRYEIQACNLSNCSSYSEQLIIEIATLGEIRNFASSLYRAGVCDYDLSWRAVTGATVYELQELKLDIDELESDESPVWGDYSSSDIRDYRASQIGYNVSPNTCDLEKSYYYRVRPCASDSVCGDWAKLELPVKVRTLSITRSKIWANVSGASLPNASVKLVYGLYRLPSETTVEYAISWNSVAGANVYYLQKKSGAVNTWSYVSGPKGKPKAFDSGVLSAYFQESSTDTQKYRLEACVAKPQVNCARGDDELEVHSYTVFAPSNLRFAEPSSVSLESDGAYSVDYGLSYRIDWYGVAYPGLDYAYSVQEVGNGLSRINAVSNNSWDSGLSARDSGDYVYNVRLCMGPNRCTVYSNSIKVRVQASSGLLFKGLASFTGGGAELPAPQNLRSGISETFDGSYVVSWDSVGTAAHYELQESTDSGITWGTIIRTAVVQLEERFDENGPVGHRHGFGNSYSYRVRACAEGTCGDWIEMQDMVRLSLGEPGALGISGGGDGDGDYSIIWAAVTGAQRYEVQEKAEGSKITTPVFRYLENNLYLNSLSFSNKPGHGSYDYQVRACMGIDGASDEYCGSWSVAGAPVDVVLSVPEGLSSDESLSYDGQYEISWSPVGGHGNAVFYEIQEKIAGSSTWPPDAAPKLGRNDANPSTINKDPNGDAGIYDYRVRSCSVIGCGEYSAGSLRVTVREPDVPMLAVADDPDAPGMYPEKPSYDGRFTLSWTGLEEGVALSYKLEQSRDGGSNWDTLFVGNDFSYELGSTTPLSVGSYQYRVRSCAGATCNTTGSPSGVQTVAVYDLSPPSLMTDESHSIDGSYTLSWASAAEGAVRYELKEGDGVPIGKGMGLKHLMSRKDTGAYSYSIRVCGERDVCGDWSSPVLVVSVDRRFAGGGGTAIDPYLIANYEQLNNMRQELGAYHKLTRNIDARASRHEGNRGCTSYNGIAVPASDACTGWEPVGDNGSSGFTGSLDGSGYIISDLYVNISVSSEAYGGLFGYVGSGSVIKNVSLTSLSVTVSSSSSSSSVGGLVGNNGGTISNSYATGDVSSSSSFTGGLVGWNNTSGTISNSYAAVSVSSSSSTGGLVGWNDGGTISNSYATGDVSSSSFTGGLVGNNGGTISNSYATGDVFSSSFTGGLVGNNTSGTISNSYWDTDTSGQTTSAGSGATGLSTLQMQADSSSASYPSALGSGFRLSDGEYPKLYQCTTCTGTLVFSTDLVPGQ